jgi:NAD(P)H-dependent flavin oxidoreductase YrpB (nitropropane dioxygenase family)
MGGGISGSPLASAVSEAGGLGTLGTGALEGIDDARGRTAKPLAANVLLPFAHRSDWAAASRADLVVTFWGRPRRRSQGLWAHQCGSVEEAREAHAASADAVIAQGVEAGGHVRGTTPALELLERVRAALPPDYPVLLAGGIADAVDVRTALDAGADAAVLGTRFLMSEESAAHPAYKQRLTESGETVLTELFGMGWPAPHRVLPNEATRRWLAKDRRGPSWLRATQRATAPVLARAPRGLQPRMLATQRPGLPFFSPSPPSPGVDERLLEASALYAGQTVARIDNVRPAAELVHELVP